MSIGLHAFVQCRGELHRVSVRRLEAFYARRYGGMLSEFSGERIRIALVFVERRDQASPRILRLETWVDEVQTDGYRSEVFAEALARQALEDTPPPCPRSGNIIDARERFRLRRLQREYDWKPSKGVMSQIEQAIMGKAATP